MTEKAVFLDRDGTIIKDKDYLDFLSICIEDELSVEGKLKNIITYHLIIYRNRQKLRNTKLM